MDYRFWHIICAHPVRAGCASAIVTKLLSAFASHSGATFIPFDPIVTVRALLELGPFHKVNEVFILLVECVTHAILRAGHSMVVNTLAAKTVVLAASWASVVIQSFVELKGSSASSRRTPSYRAIFLDEFIEAELLEFFFEVWIRVLIDICDLDSEAASLHGAEDISLSCFDFGAEVGCDTLGMEDMAAF